jgi:transcriptional regulator with XRE-family HTH domain
MSLARVVAHNLRVTRRQRKLSQESLAKRTGLSVSYISMLEREERTPPLDTLENLARALSVKPLELLHAGAQGRKRGA